MRGNMKETISEVAKLPWSKLLPLANGSIVLEKSTDYGILISAIEMKLQANPNSSAGLKVYAEVIKNHSYVLSEAGQALSALAQSPNHWLNPRNIVKQILEPINRKRLGMERSKFLEMTKREITKNIELELKKQSTNKDVLVKILSDLKCK